MPNALSPMVEQRILAMAIAFPGWGPNRISLDLGRPKPPDPVAGNLDAALWTSNPQ
jgi:hypothetical protein